MYVAVCIWVCVWVCAHVQCVCITHVCIRMYYLVHVRRNYVGLFVHIHTHYSDHSCSWQRVPLLPDPSPDVLVPPYKELMVRQEISSYMYLCSESLYGHTGGIVCIVHAVILIRAYRGSTRGPCCSPYMGYIWTKPQGLLAVPKELQFLHFLIPPSHMEIKSSFAAVVVIRIICYLY